MITERSNPLKYFTYDLLMGDNSDAWTENLKTYWSEFEKYKNRLPRRFVKEYCKHGFHDYDIDSINYSIDKAKKGASSNNIEIKISFDGNSFVIRYVGVTTYKVNGNNFAEIGNCTILYNEILTVDDKGMSHEFIIEGRNSVYLEFKRIAFKKI